MPTNPVVTDPNLTIEFPGVTQSEMDALLLEAQQQGAEVEQSQPGNDSLDTITYRKLFWKIEATCFWNAATGLTIQIPEAKYRDVIQSQVTSALGKIREAQA